MGYYQAIYFTKLEIVSIIQKIYNYIDYFKFKIVLDHLGFYIFWLEIATSICKYIQNYLFYAKQTTIAQSILLILIQTKELYELMKIDFISFFQRFAYNIYIYNLVDYFSRHIYLHTTLSANINNVIFLFN